MLTLKIISVWFFTVAVLSFMLAPFLPEGLWQKWFVNSGLAVLLSECERLQTLPDYYTEGVSNTQRYKALGNGFTVDVIAHILRGIKCHEKNQR